MPKGRLIIDGTSQINVDGVSDNTKGTFIDQGASFIGEGGHALGEKKELHSYKKLSYGRFDEEFSSFGTGETLDEESMLGSMGMNLQRVVDTRGGGIVNLVVDSYYFLGRGKQISANGFPLYNNNTITA